MIQAGVKSLNILSRGVAVLQRYEDADLKFIYEMQNRYFSYVCGLYTKTVRLKFRISVRNLNFILDIETNIKGLSRSSACNCSIEQLLVAVGLGLGSGLGLRLGVGRVFGDY